MALNNIFENEHPIPRRGSISFDYELGPDTTPATIGEALSQIGYVLISGKMDDGKMEDFAIGKITDVLIKPVDITKWRCGTCGVEMAGDNIRCVAPACNGFAVRV